MKLDGLLVLQYRVIHYPRALVGSLSPPAITALGNLDALQGYKLALFCSVKCPGDLKDL